MQVTIVLQMGQSTNYSAYVFRNYWLRTNQRFDGQVLDLKIYCLMFHKEALMVVVTVLVQYECVI